MEYGKPAFWIAIGVGGSIVAALSFGQQATTKQPDEPFRMRAVFRDFCIGAFLTTLIYMFLPESIDSWISSATGVVSGAVSKVSLPLPQLGGGDLVPSGSSGADIELQTGPARF
jgi:hypothetical protein